MPSLFKRATAAVALAAVASFTVGCDAARACDYQPGGKTFSIVQPVVQQQVRYVRAPQAFVQVQPVRRHVAVQAFAQPVQVREFRRPVRNSARFLLTRPARAQAIVVGGYR